MASASSVIQCEVNVIFVDSQIEIFKMAYEKVATAITVETKTEVAVNLEDIICDCDKLHITVE